MRLVTRDEWGAKPPAAIRAWEGRRYVVFHWFGDPTWAWVERNGGPAAAMRRVQRNHMNRGGFDIFYNRTVAQTGEAYEGRGYASAGGAQGVAGSDVRDFSVALMIGPGEAPTTEAIGTLAEVVREAARVGFRSGVRGHNDFKPKACPGPDLGALADQWVNGAPAPERWSRPGDAVRNDDDARAVLAWWGGLPAATVDDLAGVPGGLVAVAALADDLMGLDLRTRGR